MIQHQIEISWKNVFISHVFARRFISGRQKKGGDETAAQCIDGSIGNSQVIFVAFLTEFRLLDCLFFSERDLPFFRDIFTSRLNSIPEIVE